MPIRSDLFISEQYITIERQRWRDTDTLAQLSRIPAPCVGARPSLGILTGNFLGLELRRSGKIAARGKSI